MSQISDSDITKCSKWWQVIWKPVQVTYQPRESNDLMILSVSQLNVATLNMLSSHLSNYVMSVIIQFVIGRQGIKIPKQTEQYLSIRDKNVR